MGAFRGPSPARLHLSPERLIIPGGFWFPELQEINLCCFEPLSLWSFVLAADGESRTVVGEGLRPRAEALPWDDGQKGPGQCQK